MQDAAAAMRNTGANFIAFARPARFERATTWFEVDRAKKWEFWQLQLVDS
jgi:hypothetical protein